MFKRFTTLALMLAVAACSNTMAGPPAQLDTGITSSNGGGQRALGNIPNVGVTSMPAR